MSQLEIQRQNFRSWEARFFKAFKIYLVADGIFSFIFELSMLNNYDHSGVSIATVHWIAQIVLVSIVFAFLRHQLYNYAFIAYEEHYKKLWLSFTSIIALSVF